MQKLQIISATIRDDALESGLLNPKNMGVNIKTLLYQVPGGMLSNLTSQLKEQGAEDKFYEVLEEVPRVRKDLGEPPPCYAVFSDCRNPGSV